MKPMGGKKTLIENNCRDFKVKGPTYKKYKHMERQKGKKEANKHTGSSLYDFLAEEEIIIRAEDLVQRRKRKCR